MVETPEAVVARGDESGVGANEYDDVLASELADELEYGSECASRWVGGCGWNDGCADGLDADEDEDATGEVDAGWLSSCERWPAQPCAGAGVVEWVVGR